MADLSWSVSEAVNKLIHLVGMQSQFWLRNCLHSCTERGWLRRCEIGGISPLAV